MRIVRTTVTGPAGEEGGTAASGAVGARRDVDAGTLPYWLARGWKVDADDDGVADASASLAVVNAGADEDTARPVGAAAVYWKCDAGVTPSNAEPGDLIFNASA